MKSARNETSWTPPGLPAPGPGEPAVETLISVARGIARGAPWYAIAESRDLDFEEVRLWPWKFPHLWEPYIKRARKLQREELADSSLNTLGALQNSGTADESRRACESVLRYNTMMELISRQDAESAKNPGIAFRVGDAFAEPGAMSARDSAGEDDERAFLPRLPVLMPRGPNRTPRRSTGKRCELPTPEAIELLRKQLKDPDPRVAHRAARTTLIHDTRMQYMEARYETTEHETADARGYTPRTARTPELEPGGAASDPRQDNDQSPRAIVSPDTGREPWSTPTRGPDFLDTS